MPKPRYSSLIIQELWKKLDNISFGGKEGDESEIKCEEQNFGFSLQNLWMWN